MSEKIKFWAELLLYLGVTVFPARGKVSKVPSFRTKKNIAVLWKNITFDKKLQLLFNKLFYYLKGKKKDLNAVILLFWLW